MNRNSVVLACALTAWMSFVESASSSDISDLIVPQGISYSVSKIRLTRDVKVLDGKRKINVVRSTDDLMSSDEQRQSAHDATKKISTDAVVDTNVGASAEAHAGLFTGINASAEAHVGVDYNGKDETHTTFSTADSQKRNAVSRRGERNLDSQETSEQQQYGNYYLNFSISLKNLDVTENYVLRPNKDGCVYALLKGLSRIVRVPYETKNEIALDVKDQYLDFVYPIADELLLKELEGVQTRDGFITNVTVEIQGGEFPIISGSGKNVLTEMRLIELKRPTTELAILFGEPKSLSPWRVRRIHGKRSGRKGANVTIRETLDAVSAVLSEDDDMPEHVFEFEGGKLVSVCGAKFGEVHRGVDGLMLPALLLDDGAEMIINPLDEKLLSRVIRDFKKISFCNVFELSRDEFKALFCAKGRAAIKEDFFKMLKSCDKECDISDAFIAGLRFISDLPDDIEKGGALYESEYKRTKNTDYLREIVGKYFNCIEQDCFKDDSAVINAVRTLIESDQEWVSGTIRENLCFLQLILIYKKKYNVLNEFLRDERFITDTNRNQSVVLLLVNNNDFDKDLKGLKCVLENNEKLLRSVIDQPDDNGRWPLELAAFRGDVGICRLLLKHGANPNLSRDGLTPLDRAADKGFMDVVKMMVEEYGAKSDRAVYAAAFFGREDVVSYLTDRWNLDVNHVDAKYGTLLINAAAGGQTQLCKFLVGKGAKVDLAPQASWFKPLERAVMGGHKEVVEYFLSVDGSLKIEHNTVLEKCSEEMQRYLLSLGKIDNKGILLSAIKRDDATNVYAIVSKDRGLFTAEIDGSKSLLGCIILYDSVESARVLKKLGFDMNYCKEGYLKPIQYAAKIGRLKVFKFLVEECALPFGDCPEIALDNKQKDILGYLLGLKINGVNAIDINKSNYGSCSLLSKAAFNGDNEMCEWLISHGARLDVVDNKGWLPVERAVQQDKIDTVRFLVENYKMTRDVIEGAAITAACCGALSSLKYFIDDCNVSPLLVRKADKRGAGFLLSEAASNGQLKIVQYLVEEKGVPVDYTPVAYKTKLFIVPNDHWHSALRVAIAKGKQEVVEYLRSKGAKKE